MHPNKPYAIAEWGLWGIDDPAFIQQMAAFVRSHARIEFVSWFNAKQGTIFDLANKPRSRAAYRRLSPRSAADERGAPQAPSAFETASL